MRVFSRKSGCARWRDVATFHPAGRFAALAGPVLAKVASEAELLGARSTGA
jgi:hypothetical protein